MKDVAGTRNAAVEGARVEEIRFEERELLRGGVWKVAQAGTAFSSSCGSIRRRPPHLQRGVERTGPFPVQGSRATVPRGGRGGGLDRGCAAQSSHEPKIERPSVDDEAMSRPSRKR